uniref:Seven cysteines N-terminal domain-containing protein n=1 Tax=Cyclopterus lumpus TaxID=8103 RepID=A0A8C3A7K2_CYCLU
PPLYDITIFEYEYDSLCFCHLLLSYFKCHSLIQILKDIWSQLLKSYQEETALTCSRTCCLTRNFSCNLAIFHYDTTQENCFHLHCPTLESCILSHRGNAVLVVTPEVFVFVGVDPDLLVFGKYFSSNVRVLPLHYSRGNASEPLPSDKRQFMHPPPPAALPLTSAPTVKPPTTASRVLPTTTTTQPGTRQPSTLPTTTAPLSSTPETLLTTSTTSRAHSSTTPPSSSATAALSSASSATSAQPSTSPTHHHHHHTTTTSQLATSPPTPTGLLASVEGSEQYPNGTAGSSGRNHTAGSDEGQGVSGEDDLEGLGPGWHVAAHTLLVAVAICVTVLLSCCCSVLLVVSWRGQRKRMGRYRTSWRGEKGSMRLIKYVLVRENS